MRVDPASGRMNDETQRAPVVCGLKEEAMDFNICKFRKHVPIGIPDLAPVTKDVEKHLQGQGFSVHSERISTGG